MKAMVFDLDGTLIDSAPDLWMAANRLMGEADLGPIDLDTLKSFIGNGIGRLVERCFAYNDQRPANLEACIARFRTLYGEGRYAHTRLYPGVRDALEVLARRGFNLGVCTNKDEAPARAILEQLAIAGQFTAVVGGDTTAAQKPDPLPLLRCGALCGATPDELIYVGDSEIDAQTAAAAKVCFMLYTEGYRKLPVEQIAHDGAFLDFALLPPLVAVLGGAKARHAD